MPYLKMDQWLAPAESEGIKSLANEFSTMQKIDPSEKEGMLGLVSVDTSPYGTIHHGLISREEWC